MATNRSHATPHALRCNCNERHDPKCRYSRNPDGPYIKAVRPLDIDTRPECEVCHEPYESGTAVGRMCPACWAWSRTEFFS